MVGDRCGLKVFIVDQSNLQSIPPNKYLFVYLDFHKVLNYMQRIFNHVHIYTDSNVE